MISEYVFGLWQNRVEKMERAVQELQENFDALRNVLEAIRQAVDPGEEKP